MTTMTEALKANVRRFYEEAWNRGDYAVIDELFADGYVDHDAAAHTGADGRASAKAFIDVFRAGFPDVHLEIKDQVAEGDTVATRWVGTGTHRGTVLGLPATGRSIEIDGISIDRFDADGRFLEGWGTWDGVRLLRQLGAFPPGADAPGSGASS